MLRTARLLLNIYQLGKRTRISFPFLERGGERLLFSHVNYYFSLALRLSYKIPQPPLIFFFRFFGPQVILQKPNGRAPSRTGRKKGGVPCFSALAHLFGSDGRKTGFPLPCLFINNKCSFCILPCFPSFGYNALIIPIQERKFVLHLHLHIYLPILFHC